MSSCTIVPFAIVLSWAACSFEQDNKCSWVSSIGWLPGSQHFRGQWMFCLYRFLKLHLIPLTVCNKPFPMFDFFENGKQACMSPNIKCFGAPLNKSLCVSIILAYWGPRTHLGKVKKSEHKLSSARKQLASFSDVRTNYSHHSNLGLCLACMGVIWFAMWVKFQAFFINS